MDFTRNVYKMLKALKTLLLTVAFGTAQAQVQVHSILGENLDVAASFLRARGYEVLPYSDDSSSYKAIFHDRTKEYMDGSFTVCKRKVITSSIGLDPDTEYPNQMALLIAQYGQPDVKVETAQLKGGDTTYIDFRWVAGTDKIVLSDMPPSPFWATSSPHRTVLLSLYDTAKTCF
ncbi:hypothetical protein [Cupriavidus sp. D384]|uniref:hypothetical protein n=1 Tax=Cupriavidus sp. D384 TaxID=1538095 RepID=UPI00083058D0|nr:hypothetical protein [Cupriavidus sp. D384]